MYLMIGSDVMNSVYEYIKAEASKFPLKPAVIVDDEAMSYSELLKCSEKVADFLMSLHLGEGTRVQICSEVTTKAVAAVLGIIRSGCILVTSHPASGINKMKINAHDSGAEVLITDQNWDLSEVIGSTGIKQILYLGEDKANESNIATYHSVMGRGVPNRIEESPSQDSLAAIFYTSGTTSRPKGVMITHKNMVRAYENIKTYLKYSSNDVILNIGNFGSDLGFYNVFLPIMAGGTSIPFEEPKHAAEIESMVQSYKVTALQLVPPYLYDAFCTEDIDTSAYSTVRFISSTGQPLPKQISGRIAQLLPGVEIYSMYGMAECKRISYLPPDQILVRPDSVGKEIHGVRAFIVDDQGNEIIQPHQVGQLVVVSDMVMKGYWKKPEENERSLRNDFRGFDKALFTGDLFYRDEEGFLFYSSRIDQVFSTATCKINPLLIEREFMYHPAVQDAVIVPKSDERAGLVAKAFVVKKEGFSLTEAQLREFLLQRIEPYMIPREIVIVDSLPRTCIGKPDRRALAGQE
jgi:long-chain acyl-CoA synthetase